VRISIVAAIARGRVIGRDNAIPWRIPEDARRFRAITMGHPVVMGRRTWDSLPARYRPLPGRRNVVLSRDPDWRASGAERAGSLDEALRLVDGAARVFVIGGADVYSAALPVADDLLLTEIDADVDGDTVFPPFDVAQYEETSRERLVSDAGVPLSFVTYSRRASAP
jgi:dihydrofolate reductase